MEEKWYFTFGVNHKHVKKYVIISGDYAVARDKMVSVFGLKWSMQYSWPEFERQIEQYNLFNLGICDECINKIYEAYQHGLSD